MKSDAKAGSQVRQRLMHICSTDDFFTTFRRDGGQEQMGFGWGKKISLAPQLLSIPFFPGGSGTSKIRFKGTIDSDNFCLKSRPHGLIRSSHMVISTSKSRGARHAKQSTCCSLCHTRRVQVRV